MRKVTNFLAAVMDGSDVFLLAKNAENKVYEPLGGEKGRQMLSPNGKGLRERLEKCESVACIRDLNDEKAWRRVLKKSDADEQRAACQALLGIKDAFEAPENPAKILLVALLANVMDLALPQLPGGPIVHVGCPSGVPLALKTLIRAVSGPDERRGKDWSLKRPTTLTPIIPLGETVPSLMLDAYVGGRVRDWKGRKRRFWLPSVRQAIIVAPNLPHEVAKRLLKESPLAVPLICGSFRLQMKERVVLDIDASAFLNFDPSMVDELVQFEELICAQLHLFAQRLHQKRKRWKRCAEDIGTFIPRIARGRFVQELSSPELVVLACGLALLKEFLRFAADRCGWLTADEAQRFLLDYWRLVLPESAPVNGIDAGGQMTGNYRWDDPLTFWAFLTGYLREHVAAITATGSLAKREEVGILRQMPDGVKYLIFPRSVLLQAYVSWLQTRHACIPSRDGRWEVRMQTEIANWGVRIKTEGKDVTWRFTFYQQGQAPDGLRDKLACLAFPIDQLPKEVMETLKSKFGCGFGPEDPLKVNREELAKNEHA